MVLIEDGQCSKRQKEPIKVVDDVDNRALRILLAEDDHEMRTLLAESLRGSSYDVVECPNGWDLLENLGNYVLPGSEHKKVDLVISDIRMPGVTGLEILAGMQHIEDCPPIILITAFGDRATHERAERCGVAAMFDKPFDVDDLLVKVRDIVPRVNLT